MPGPGLDVLVALGRGSLQCPLSTDRLGGRAGETWLSALQICCTCPRCLRCSSEHCCQPHAPLMGSRATYLAHGWRDSPPNALYSPLCRLLQQMTRSQQMDELLDVLIESGGTHCFSVPSRASPPSGIRPWGPELSVCPSGAA